MPSLSFIIDGLVDYKITIEEVRGLDGFYDLKFTIDALEEASGLQADLRAFFFDIKDEALLPLLSVQGSDVTNSKFSANTVNQLSNDANIKGEITNKGKNFDGGVEFGTPGISKDDIDLTNFTLSLQGGDLKLDQFAEQRFGIRATSVGPAGNRSDGFKVAGVAPLLREDVGYYDVLVGQGEDYQVNEIEKTGQEAVKIFDLSANELSGLKVLNVYNPGNDFYGQEYLANLGNIQNAVANGMTLIIHDRYVEEAESILPGGGSFDIIRDFSDDANIDLLPDAIGTIDVGPGGVLTDLTLDDGTSSSHGFAVQGSLPAEAELFLSRTNDSEIVTFGYKFGAGYVIYSSIPLDYYSTNGLSGSSELDSAFEAYAANIINYGANV